MKKGKLKSLYKYYRQAHQLLKDINIKIAANHVADQDKIKMLQSEVTQLNDLNKKLTDTIEFLKTQRVNLDKIILLNNSR